MQVIERWDFPGNPVGLSVPHDAGFREQILNDIGIGFIPVQSNNELIGGLVQTAILDSLGLFQGEVESVFTMEMQAGMVEYGNHGDVLTAVATCSTASSNSFRMSGNGTSCVMFKAIPVLSPFTTLRSTTGM